MNGKLLMLFQSTKKDPKNNVENYRPISLTSLVMKIFEKLIRSELMLRCETAINDWQHGFPAAQVMYH